MKCKTYLLATVGVWVTLLPCMVESVECGHWYSNDCLADEDIRYDDEASNTITDQAIIWGKLHGLYRSTVTGFGPTGEKLEEGFFNLLNTGGTTSFPYSSANPPYEQFINLSFIGSRHYQHRYSIFPAASTEFCNRTAPVGLLNVIPPGVCGANGISIASEAYATSSYEKDGRFVIIPFGRTLFGLPINRQGYISMPVDDNTFYASFQDDQTFFSSTTVCLDNECNQWTTLLEVYDKFENVTTLSASSRLVATRIESKEEFVAEIWAAYDRLNVVKSQQIQAPMVDTCLTGFCPNETDFCTLDPNCSDSPYQEPRGSVKAGPIVGFVVAFFLLLFGVLLVGYRYHMAQRDARIRAKFARRIAETIKVVGSERQLTPENLAAEFKQIDTDNGGEISKDELWEFISSGKAGDLNQSDFNALFAAIDLDNSGSVDFMEFTAFFGKCSSDFERVKNRQSVLMARHSMSYKMAEKRASTADMSASYLANLAKIGESDGEQGAE